MRKYATELGYETSDEESEMEQDNENQQSTEEKNKDNQTKFFQKLKEILKRHDPQNICIVGDFNIIFDKELDRQLLKLKKRIKTNLLKRPFLELVEKFNLIDVWRTQKGTAKEFTYYSERHQTWASIDSCWMSAHLVKEVIEVEIKLRSFSNHNPVIIKIRKKQRIKNLRMNPLDLEQEEFIEKLSKKWKNFIK